jgi:hypothetical protein
MAGTGLRSDDATSSDSGHLLPIRYGAGKSPAVIPLPALDSGLVRFGGVDYDLSHA